MENQITEYENILEAIEYAEKHFLNFTITLNKETNKYVVKDDEQHS